MEVVLLVGLFVAGVGLWDKWSRWCQLRLIEMYQVHEEYEDYYFNAWKDHEGWDNPDYEVLSFDAWYREKYCTKKQPEAPMPERGYR